jgi:hypothetical protein
MTKNATLADGEAMPSRSRRHLLLGLAAASAAGAAVPVATPSELLAGLSHIPSPIGKLLGDLKALEKSYGDAAEAEYLIRADVETAVDADKTKYEISWQTPGPFKDRIYLHPRSPEARNWRERVERSAAGRHGQVWVTWWGPGGPDALHALVEADKAKAFAQGEAAEAAYAVLIASMGLDRAQQKCARLEVELDAARAALVGYRPQSIHEVAEKAAALADFETCFEDDEVRTILRSLMPQEA